MKQPKSLLPQPNPAKKKHVSMAVELPYSAGPESVKILTADSVIEIAVSIINDRPDILPDTLIEIVRGNIRADYDNLGFESLDSQPVLATSLLNMRDSLVEIDGSWRLQVLGSLLDLEFGANRWTILII
jgi:hypothetical protein